MAVKSVRINEICKYIISNKNQEQGKHYIIDFKHFTSI